MRTETIEWFTPEERLPEFDSEISMKYSHATLAGWFTKADGFVMYNDEKAYTPLYWAYAPKGPQ